MKDTDHTRTEQTTTHQIDNNGIVMLQSILIHVFCIASLARLDVQLYRVLLQAVLKKSRFTMQQDFTW